MSALLRIWAGALAVASVGTWLLFDSAWGLNLPVWTATVLAVLLLCARPGAGRQPALGVVIGLAIPVAGGTAVTADAGFQGWTVIVLGALLAIATLLAADGRASRVGATFMLGAPVVALVRGATEVERRVTELVERVSSERSRPWVRGALIALPVLVVFALLLANADPVFASLRQRLLEALQRWDFASRLVFFWLLLLGALGAAGHAQRGPGAPAGSAPPRVAWPSLGITERLVVLVAVAGLFAIFLLLQLSYLFGNAPAVAGSGITFAEYARRGFNELTIVATLCALLIVALDHHAVRGTGEPWARLAAIGLVAETLLLLVSAFRRVWLYEAAYGFTTTRLYAQAYMVVMALALLLLAWAARDAIDPRALARRTAALGVLAFVTLTCWNHEAWIASVNLERGARTGVLDTAYLVQGLSANAVPALVAALSSAPESVAQPLRDALRGRYAAVSVRECRWFEWNLRHAQAARALSEAGLGRDARPRRGGCLKLAAMP
jgi:hypothetical protein